MTPEARADIAKLIPLIGSPLDGEALAAARAIARKLEARGLTLHDLAALVGGGARPAPPPRPATRTSDAPAGGEPLSSTAARAMIREIRMSKAVLRLSGWEQGYLDVLAHRLDAGLVLNAQDGARLRQLHDRTFAKAEA